MLVLAGCTKGGQFDPTDIFNSDTFDTKKKLKGDREPVFPNGVPGTTTGVPPDLVKGYQPPADQADAGIPPAPEPVAAAVKPKPKPAPKPTPKVAAAPAPAQGQDPVWSQKPVSAVPPGPTRISVGAKAPASQQATPPQASSSATPWPASPQSAPAQQAAQPSQSVWPNPPAPGTSSH
ncbi:MAG: hypothetical protein ABSE22_11365 [Xanthobacteraceae bacterium]